MVTKKNSTKKAPVKRTTSHKTAPKTKRTTVRTDKVDYYPNRMPFAVVTLAVCLLVMIGLLIVIRQKNLL